MELFDLIVVGEGLASSAFLFEAALCHKERFKGLKILQLSAKEFAPCSLNTTAIVSKHGTKKGFSPLGDLVVDSFDRFDKHFKKDLFQGVFPVEQFHKVHLENKENFLRRHGKISKIKIKLPDRELEINGAIERAYLCHPDSFLNGLHSFIDENLAVKRIADRVVSIRETENVHVDLASGKTLEAKKIFLGLGGYHQYLEKNIESMYQFERSKKVPGTYCEFKGHDSWPNLILSGEGYNLCHREGIFILGGTKWDQDNFAPNFFGLEEIRKKALDDWGGLVEIPSLKETIIKTGLRSKGIKRTPYFDQVSMSSKIVTSHGLYKNGFTYAFFGGSQILTKILT